MKTFLKTIFQHWHLRLKITVSKVLFGNVDCHNAKSTCTSITKILCTAINIPEFGAVESIVKVP